MKYSYLFQDPYISKTILKKINILFNSVRTRPGMYFGTNISLDILNMYIQSITFQKENTKLNYGMGLTTYSVISLSLPLVKNL